MLITINTIRQYLHLPSKTTNQEIISALNLIGHEVDSTFNVQSENTNLKVGQITKISAHPKRDRISVCTVKTTAGTFKILCGATNFKLNDKVVVAMDNAVLYNGVKINYRDLAGIKSEGMLCSLQELGYPEKMIPSVELDGIHILNPTAKLEDDVFDHLDNDTILNLNLTPNRGDCLSFLGLCRDLAAYFDCRMNQPVLKAINSNIKPPQDLDVKITSKECTDYLYVFMDQCKIGPSPKWLVEILQKNNIRSINNVVDLTNFVMLETGVPLHAYDYKKTSNQFAIYDLDKSQKFFALDQVDYQLKPKTTVIGDHKDIYALSGIMGGNDTGISDSTTQIFLECANWTYLPIRKLQHELNLFTDAGRRYNYFVDACKFKKALTRFLNLCDQLKITIKYSAIETAKRTHLDAKKIILSVAKVKRVLGIILDQPQISNLLARLGFTCCKSDIDKFIVSVPTDRFDITNDVDLIEEIARLIDINSFPDANLSVTLQHYDHFDFQFKKATSEYFSQRGFYNCTNYSLVSQANAKLYNYFNYSDLAHLHNYSSQEHNCMRTSLLFSLLQSYNYNFNQYQKGFNFYELDEIHTLKTQKLHLAGILSQPVACNYLDIDAVVDLNYLKALLGAYFKTLNIKFSSTLKLSYKKVSEKQLNCLMHPYNQLHILLNGKKIGFIGKINPDLDFKKINYQKHNTYLFEIVLSKVIELLNECQTNHKKINYDWKSQFFVENDFTFESSNTNDVATIISLLREFPACQSAILTKKYFSDRNKKLKWALTFKVKLALTSDDSQQHQNILSEMVAAITKKCPVAFKGKLI